MRLEFLSFLVLVVASVGGAGCLSGEAGPACDSGDYAWKALVPGPGEEGFDSTLSAKASLFDRQFSWINASSTGVTADVQVPSDPATLEALRATIREGAETFDASQVVSWGKAAGLYAGAGIAADGFKYAVLRDQGAACGAVEAARKQFVKGLQALHRASVVTGVPGVIARGFIRRDLPGGSAIETVPMFDEAGAPLPIEKNNGTWREDRSGDLPDLIWEDSCSRDMLLGWALAFSVYAQVGRTDHAIDAALKVQLRDDAAAIGRELAKVRESGFDLEIPDADGRTTFHGYLNENTIDRAYVPGANNGMNAAMALGIVGALAAVADDPELTDYFEGQLIDQRDLPGLVGRGVKAIFFGADTNGSNVNMTFTAMWLALQHVREPGARGELVRALDEELYNAPVAVWRPSLLKQSLFDFIFAAASGDREALARGLSTLSAFAEPPYRAESKLQCDEAELTAKSCTLADGSIVTIEGEGRGGNAIASTPLEMKQRPPSNYHWRSNPYSVNGEAGAGDLYSGVDFRLAYWLGRWTRVE